MPNNSYEANLISAYPLARERDSIVANVTDHLGGKGTDITASSVAAIELHLHDGRVHYSQGRHQAAVFEFQRARGLIYQLIYPAFDVDYYARTVNQGLPVSPQIEKDLIAASSRILQVIKPNSGPPPSAVAPGSIAAIPNALSIYNTTGFREMVVGDAALEQANARAVTLLRSDRPAAAVEVLNEALQTRPNGADTGAVRAAMQLNLSAALVQVGEFDSASQAAHRAQALFESRQDTVGMAQATHVAAVSARQLGHQNDADEQFARAATMLRETPAEPAAAATHAAAFALPVTVNAHTLSGTALTNLGALSARSSNGISRATAALSPIAESNADTLSFRLAGADAGWGTLPVLDAAQREELARPIQIGVPVGMDVETFTFSGETALSTVDLTNKVYVRRKDSVAANDIQWAIIDGSTTTVYLTHLYSYVLPVALGDAFRAMGLFEKADQHYVLAAGYSYLNAAIEGTALWIRLARNTLEWANSLFKNDELAAAKAQYGRLIAEDGTVPASVLYDTAAFAAPVAEAKTLINGLQITPLPVINWEIADILLTARSYQLLMVQGLDFFGLLLSPIHTFEYLQNIARGFAISAIESEREFVTFKMRQESEQATRQELQSASALAKTEAQARDQQYKAAQHDGLSAKAAADLAQKRATNADAQRTQYQGVSQIENWSRAASQAVGGGEDADYGEISGLADRLARGESIEGEGPILAAAATLNAGKRTAEYELEKMRTNVEELGLAVDLAKSEQHAATAREESARLSLFAAQQREQFANQALRAFDQEFFTPEAWSKMADVMRDISRSYLYRATRIAKLMERSYNFENDTDLRIIRSEYGTGFGINALLGGDSLRQDLESFTFHAVTGKTRKASRIKDNLSLATLFPAHFEEFRRTGRLVFETDLYEFDRLHPGFWGQRIEAVEVQLVGLLPQEGLNGTLAAGGVTSYRSREGALGKRVHVVDTAALSNFVVRNDGFLYEANSGVRGLFQGLGLGSTWQIQLPKRSNDFDYRRIFDVNLVLYYTAQFDAGLRDAVLNAPTRPGEFSLLRTFSLRHDFPDAWYSLYRDGGITFTLDRSRLPFNQTGFKTKEANFRIVTRPGIAASGIDLEITTPGGLSATLTTDANGAISCAVPALAALSESDPLGDWKVRVAGGASIVDGGQLKFDRVYNLQFGLQYEYDPAPEEI